MQLLIDKSECCGCNTCQIVCPTNAITMVKDLEGFNYPNIDNFKCIDCGLCKKNCAFQNYLNKNSIDNFPKFFAAKNKDDSIRMKSSSGGIFSSLAKAIIESGGVVYGAIINNEMKVIHIKTDSLDGLNKMRGSKYVQSELNDIFKEIREEIKNKKVLFSGTPCQISALKLYLKNKDMSKLYLCDIVCHGVPSPKLWDEHISLIEKTFNKNIKEYNFRSKINGWGIHTESIKFDDDSLEYRNGISQSFKYLFYTNAALRPSCYNCKYTNLNRESDITIADFWGIEKSMPEFKDNLGVSLVLINSKKGYDLFKELGNLIISIECEMDDCLQPNMLYPSKAKTNRDLFWNIYFNKGYKHLLKKYSSYGAYYHLRQLIKKLLIKK